MQFITYKGETVALFLLAPNWAQAVKLELQLPFTDITKGLSAREQRRAFGDSARYSLEYSVTTADAKTSTDLRLWLNRLKGETVAVPLWTDGVEISAIANAGVTSIAKTSVNPAQYGAEWIIMSADASTFEIVTVTAISGTTVTLLSGTTLTWAAGTLMYPLLFGRLDKRPQLTRDTDEAIVSGVIRFQENSPFARKINPLAGTIATVGASVSDFATLPLFPLYPDETDPQDQTEADIVYRPIGFQRVDQQYVYAQAVRRPFDLPIYAGTRDDIATVTRLFVDRRGPVRKLMVPTHRGDIRLASDAASGATSITIEQPSRYSDTNFANHPGHRYLALVDRNSIEPIKVNTITGGLLALAAALTQTHAASGTKVSQLMLGRFADAKLSWTYITDAIATCTLRFTETPDEYVTPQTDLQERAYLYRFTEAMPTPLYSSFTSYENAIVYAGTTFAPAPFSHGSLKTGLKLDQEKIDITSFDFTGNPLRKIIDSALEGKLFLDIYDVNPANADDGSAKVIATGEVIGLDPTGKDWKATVLAFGHFLDSFPNFYRQKVCNVVVYSPKCGVDKTLFKSTSTIAALSSAAGNTYVDAATLTQADDYFSDGFLETGSGSYFERRAILNSDAIVGGGQRLYLNRPLLKAALGQPINLYPGCNGSVERCRDFFNNLVNFRGFPFIPDKNPSANVGQIQQATGGKKG
jgi:uncharacterized phage protein (TIGR02218 family)